MRRDAREPRARRDTGPVIDSLGGYRLLRTVGAGPRAEVFLAHPLRPDAPPVPAVIKIYGSSVSDESVFAEIEALTRARGDHVVGVLDVVSTESGAPALILTRHAAGSLARLLADRPHVEPGEAVTLLAPLATTLARLHAAGVAHGAIGAGAVLFDVAGSPTLACFGRAVLFPPGLPAAGLESEPAVLADVLAFGALATTVLERAGAPDLARRARTEAASGGWLTDFADELFDIAEPLPLGVASRAPVAHVPFPARAVAAQPSVVVPEPETSPRRDWRGLLDRALGSLRRVRRRAWVMAGVGVGALVIAVAIVPSAPSGAIATPSASPTTAATVVDEGPVTGDDPVAAALVLLQAREGCIRDLSVECFDLIDQADSSALDADRALVRSVLGGAELPPLPKPTEATLTQRLGDSALVALGSETEPASLLLVKGEAGWRIRDYLEE